MIGLTCLFESAELELQLDCLFQALEAPAAHEYFILGIDSVPLTSLPFPPPAQARRETHRLPPRDCPLSFASHYSTCSRYRHRLPDPRLHPRIRSRS